MKHHPLTKLALIAGFAFLATPAAFAGDQARDEPWKQVSAEQTQYYAEQTPSSGSSCRQKRCARQCAHSLRRLESKRPCTCAEYYYRLKGGRAHSYLSAHYPPYRYAR